MKYLVQVLALCFVVISFSAVAADEQIKFGVYKLKGTNPDGLKKYDGQIVIEKEGVNYRVTWFIGPDRNQAQSGIGILENKVLSVGYMDASGQDFGVVSLKVVNSGLLKGKWASLFSRGSFGEEEFSFETEKIPEGLKPKPKAAPKKNATSA